MESIAAAIAFATESLHADPKGSLCLVARHRLWLSFGPVEREGKRILLTAGTLRRAHLARSAAATVFPIWYSYRPTDHAPDEMLALQEDYIRGRIDLARATAAADTFSSSLEEQYMLSNTNVYAGKAAVAALQTPLYESEMSEPYIRLTADTELDPWGWDAGLAASIAAAGGAAWDDAGSSDRRRQFWAYYLSVAAQFAGGGTGWTISG